MSEQPQPQRQPRFRPEDRVRPVGPSVHPRREEVGVVTAVTDSAGVYRYRVSFPDGSSQVFFGFELEGVE